MKTANEFLEAFRLLPAASREKIIAACVRESETPKANGEAPELLTDAEVAAILRIKPDTLAKHLRQGPPRGRARNVIDARLIRHIYVGGARRWLRQSVLDALNGEGE